MMIGNMVFSNLENFRFKFFFNSFLQVFVGILWKEKRIPKVANVYKLKKQQIAESTKM